MTMGTRTDVHSLMGQVRMGFESNCLLGQLEIILWIADSEAGVKSGVAEGEGEGTCGNDVVGLLAGTDEV